VTALLLWGGLVFGLHQAIWSRQASVHKPSPKGSGGVEARGFSHYYPPDPAEVERPKVTGGAPRAPKADVISARVTISSFDRLAALLPHGVLVHLGGSAWLVTRPVAIDGPTRLIVTGPAALDLAPRSFLLVGDGGVASLTGVTITGVDANLQPLRSPQGDRGFVSATDEGRLWLDQDVISSLGHGGVQAYGISLEKPGPGSGVVNSSITNNYFGIYTAHAVGVKITGNRVMDSWVYGIDPHTESSDISIQDNYVAGSGVHGIVLAARVIRSSVVGNVVTGSKDHGIVVFDRSDGNVVQGNTITGSFDGIVIQDSSDNKVSGNMVRPVARFGIRVSGRSRGNTLSGNTISGALVGAYLYEGPTGNRLLNNKFIADAEWVRVRSDAPGNVVQPIPARSEL